MRNRKIQVTVVMGVFTILLSSLALIGWLLDIGVLKSVLPGLNSMKFNTAVCLLLLGFCLLFIDKAGKPYLAYLITACSAIVAIVGLLTTCEYAFNWNIGIDNLWKEGPAQPIPFFPGRPSAPAAVSFLLLGIVLLTGKNNRFRFFILCSLVIVTLIASLTFLGYIFRIPYINTSPTLSKLALNTSVAFIAVAAGIYYSDQLRSLLLSFRQKLAAGFLLIILMLSLILYIYTQNDKGFVNSARWVEHTNEILYRSEKMLSL